MEGVLGAGRAAIGVSLEVVHRIQTALHDVGLTLTAALAEALHVHPQPVADAIGVGRHDGGHARPLRLVRVRHPPPLDGVTGAVPPIGAGVFGAELDLDQGVLRGPEVDQLKGAVVVLPAGRQQHLCGEAAVCVHASGDPRVVTLILPLPRLGADLLHVRCCGHPASVLVDAEAVDVGVVLVGSALRDGIGGRQRRRLAAGDRITGRGCVVAAAQSGFCRCGEESCRKHLDRSPPSSIRHSASPLSRGISLL